MQAPRNAGRSVSAPDSEQDHRDKLVRARRRKELFEARLSVVDPLLKRLDRVNRIRIVWFVITLIAVELVGLDVIGKVLPLIR